MNPFRKPLIALGTFALAGSLALTGCTTAATNPAATDAAPVADSATAALDTSYIAITDLTELTYDGLGLPDFDVETSGARTVTLADGATTAIDGVKVAHDSDAGDVVTITAGGVYRLTGTLGAGQVVIDAGDDDVTVILDGVNITSASVGALVVTSADDVQVFLEAGSANSLADASGATASEETDAPNATLYSTADLWIGGTGSLAVNGANDGITSKDSLVIDGGTYSVTAADDGIRGKDHLVVLDGELAVTAGGDGLTSDDETGGTDAAATVGVVWIASGTIDITAGDDGIQGYRQVTIADGTVTVAAEDDGVHSEGVLRIADGTVTVSKSYEGLEAAVMLLSGGDVAVTASDDGINVAGGPGVTSGGDAEMGDAGMGGGGMGAGGGAGGGPARPGDTAAAGTSTTDTTSSTTSSTGTATMALGTSFAATTASATTASATTASSTTASSTTMAAPGGGMDSGADSGRYLDITGGTIVVNAGGDGIDVGGVFTMSDGVVVVSGPTDNGNGALDVDGDFTVTGGALLAAGSSGMAMAPTSEGQGTLNASFSSNVAAGTRVTVLAADGSVLASYVAPKEFASFVLTTSAIDQGTSYSFVTDGTVTGGSEVGPVVFGGAVTGASDLGTLAAN